jgi:hypothetical protein
MPVIYIVSLYFGMDMKKILCNMIFHFLDVIYLHNTSFIVRYNLPVLSIISSYIPLRSTSLFINLYHPDIGYFKPSILQGTWPEFNFGVTVYHLGKKDFKSLDTTGLVAMF